MPGTDAPWRGREPYPKDSAAAWVALCRRLGATATSDAAEAAGVELLERWSEPHRRYHSRSHLASVLGALDALFEASGEGTPGAHDLARAAAWYHDAVYDPARSDNEEQSAEFAERQLASLGVDPTLRAEVTRLVRLTRDHKPGHDDEAGSLLCDADLSILATEPEMYEKYTAAVREEYGHLTDEEFRAGRITVLRSLAGHVTLFHTPYARQHWEGTARANLDRERRSLM